MSIKMALKVQYLNHPYLYTSPIPLYRVSSHPFGKKPVNPSVVVAYRPSMKTDRAIFCFAFKTLSAKNAAALDKELMSTGGFSIDQLMELAGLSVAEAGTLFFSPSSLEDRLAFPLDWE